MLRSIQDGFQDVHFKFTVRLLMAKDKEMHKSLPKCFSILVLICHSGCRMDIIMAFGRVDSLDIPFLYM